MRTRKRIKTDSRNSSREREADRRAEEIMSRRNVIQRNSAKKSGKGLISHEEAIHLLDGMIQEKQSVNPALNEPIPQNTVALDLKTGGNPLSEKEREFFEPAFNRDFSDVRIHTDADSAQMAETLGARAFASGRDIVFGKGGYAPDTYDGQKLMAHELAHVSQLNKNKHEKSFIQKKELNRNKDTYEDRVRQYLELFKAFVSKKIREGKEYGSKKIDELPWQAWIIEFAKYHLPNVDKLSENEKKEKFKTSVNDTVMILLYEFATGTGDTPREFTQEHPITRKIMKGNAVEEALHVFYITNRYKKINELKDIKYKFKFSPNAEIEEIGNLPKAIKEHLNAAREIILDKEWSTLFLGGIDVTITPISEKEIEVKVENTTDKKSLMLHAVESIEREEGKNTVFGTIVQEFKFIIPLNPDRLISEEDRNIKDNIDNYLQYLYEMIILKSLN